MRFGGVGIVYLELPWLRLGHILKKCLKQTEGISPLIFYTKPVISEKKNT